MPQDFSFDVVSKVDAHLIAECVQVAMKELANRFDFKGSISKIEFDEKAMTLTVTSDNEFKLKSVLDILDMRLAKRGLPIKNFVRGKIETALGGAVREPITVQNGIPSDKAREMVADIKKAKLKVNVSIQGDQLRVASKIKDQLQAVMTLLRGKDYDLSVQFTNRR